MTQFDRDKLSADLLHHYGRKLQPGDSVLPPVTPTAVFHLPGAPSNAPFQYGRYHNPTWEALEDTLSLLEGAETLIFPSGMAAISAVLFSNFRSGDSLLLPADGYYVSRLLSEKYLAPNGIRVETRPTSRFLEGGFDGYKLVIAETPSNPGLDVCDIAAVSARCKASGAVLAVDNTTMTPLGQRPLDLGADIVISSDTKCINGHSDTLLGHVASRDAKLLAAMRDWRRVAGSIVGPFEAFLVFRGLETLELRFQRACQSAAVIAERLQAHPAVSAVRYPGLPNDPAHAIAKRQMTTFGFMITLTLTDGAKAEQFINACAHIQPSTSFGGVRTCAERRIRWGDAVPEGFVRLSVGIEPLEPLWRSIEKSLDSL